MVRQQPAPLAPERGAPRPAHLRRLRMTLADGARTTVHVARYDAVSTDVRLLLLRRPAPLEAWCAARGRAISTALAFLPRA